MRSCSDKIHWALELLDWLIRLAGAIGESELEIDLRRVRLGFQLALRRTAH